MKRVLIITYYWPPGGGAGVQRWLKMARYLPEYGIEPVILTVQPEYATYPVTDLSLLHDIPPTLEVHRTKATDYFRMFSRDKSAVPSAGFAGQGKPSLMEKLARFVRGNFFIPDPRKGWNSFAYKKACELVKSQYISTSPPHSTQLIGLKLKKKFPAINWIADLRDPWTDIYYYSEFYPTFPARLADRRYEKSVITRADTIISVGKRLSQLYSDRYPSTAEKFRVIPNGFDAADFAGLIPIVPERFTITYVGTLSQSYNIVALAEALALLHKSGKDFVLRFTGMVSDQQKRLLLEKLPTENLIFNAYCYHSEAVKEVLSASLLLLLIPEHKSSRVILTGKLFEYIATGKPVLSIGPVDGDAVDLVNTLSNGKAVDFNDSDGLTNFITAAMDGSLPAREYLPESFSRKSGAAALATILGACC
jgi:glycosyltransferase involved in cell wall biosynthesis